MTKATGDPKVFIVALNRNGLEDINRG